MTRFFYDRNIFQTVKHGFTLPDAKEHYAPDLEIEPIHTRINLSVDPWQKSAAGFCDITLRGNVAGGQTLALDAMNFENLTVAALDSPVVSHRYDGSKIYLFWTKPFAADECRQIRVGYTVIEPVTGIVFSTPTNDQPDAPILAASDNESERGRYWFPSVDFMTVRTTLEFFLTAQKELTILANGFLADEVENTDGTKTAHWKLDYPCPSYLVCFAIGNFNRYDDETVDGIAIRYFADKSYRSEDIQRTFAKTPDMLRWLPKKLGIPFPFPKYYQVAVREIGGAMENISLVSWDDQFLQDELYAGEIGYRTDLVNIHEMTHSYFGDAVVSRDFAHVWLKESWATYMESVWLEDHFGKDAKDWQIYHEKLEYLSEADETYIRPIVTRRYDSSWSMFDRHLYPGGAIRLNMLREKLGDDKFWAGVQDYLRQNMGSTTETVDFVRAMENASGKNLGKWFDQWFHGLGYPKLKIEYCYHDQAAEATFIIEQTQVEKEKNIGLFDLDLEILWRDKQGVDHLETVRVSEARHVLVKKMDDPEFILIDPAQKIVATFEFNPGDVKLLSALHQATSILGQIQAISELAKTGKRANIQAVEKFWSKSLYWGIRIHIFRELAKVHNEFAINALSRLLKIEDHSMVLEHAAIACGQQRDPVLRAALLAKLETKNLLYKALAAILVSIGKQNQADDLELLSNYTGDDSWRRIVSVGAWTGIGYLGSETGFEMLLENLTVNVKFFNEQVARVTALALSAAKMPDHSQQQAIDALIDLTRSNSPNVRISAARELATLHASRAIPVIQALKTRQANQDAPLLERLIQQINSGTKPGEEAIKARKQIEELESKLAKLETRLQEVEARNPSK
ncbi:MAG TPA: hypothetical protein DHU63_06075 [Candidatus Marinimicrobia bacterium]|nr:hypothetical protein [Candidatus Neomarinimicrobiota bacterium]